MILLSKLVSIRGIKDEKNYNNNCSCEACGRDFENCIELTNLSAMPMETYDACPFCFSKLDEDVVLERLDDLKESTLKNQMRACENRERISSSEKVECPHHFGYLKKRPKNTPIPDTCLTCEKMIQCVL